MLNRYRTILLVLLLGIVFLSACGKSAAQEVQDSFLEGEPTDIQALVGSDDFPVGHPRVPILLYSGTDQVSDAKAVVVTLYDLKENPPQARWSGEAINYSDYAIPYWVVYPELPSPGIWGLSTKIRKVDGEDTTAQLIIEATNGSMMPLVDTQPYASQNRTLATEPDITKLTSAAKPNKLFYEMTIAEAMKNGKPSVIVFATPGFCQTKMCSPVLSSVEEVQKVYAEQVNFIHIEVFKEFPPNAVVDKTLIEWNLSSEPWTFVLNAQGAVSARLGGPVSPQELTEQLDAVLK